MAINELLMITHINSNKSAAVIDAWFIWCWSTRRNLLRFNWLQPTLGCAAAQRAEIDNNLMVLIEFSEF